MRTILLVTVASVVLSSTTAASWAAAPKPRVNVSPNLQKNLENDLQARKPKEFAFIARVIELIGDGTLGEPVVRSTFLWARKKPRRKFQYFERGLRYRATKMGIDLD